MFMYVVGRIVAELRCGALVVGYEATASLLVQHMSMCMCKTTKADNSRTMIVVDTSMPVALCFIWHGSLDS